MEYIAIAVVVFAVALLVLVPWANKRTCIAAFERGALASVLPFCEIMPVYSKYFSPFRPMDAAAYRYGVGWGAHLTVFGTENNTRSAFSRRWREIVDDATALRMLVKLMGIEHASVLMSVPIGEEAMKLINEDLGLSPVEALATAAARVRDGEPPPSSVE